jgi:hypothetical protein
MTTRNHELLHADHLRWKSEVAMWRQDIEEWQREQARLLADLETALGAEVEALRQHKTTIVHQEGLIESHERLISQLEASGGRSNHDEIEARMAAEHDKEAGRHESMALAHERIKRHHHRAMSRLAVVLKALGHEA